MVGSMPFWTQHSTVYEYVFCPDIELLVGYGFIELGFKLFHHIKTLCYEMPYIPVNVFKSMSCNFGNTVSEHD